MCIGRSLVGAQPSARGRAACPQPAEAPASRTTFRFRSANVSFWEHWTEYCSLACFTTISNGLQFATAFRTESKAPVVAAGLLPLPPLNLLAARANLAAFLKPVVCGVWCVTCGWERTGEDDTRLSYLACRAA